jgi:hypothetical protein
MATYSSIPTPVGLHDGNLIQYERHRDQLIASVSAWEVTKLTLIFGDVWVAREFDAIGSPTGVDGNLDDLRECFDTALIEEVKRRMNDIHCNEAKMDRLRHYQLCDDSGTSVLKVIASSMEVRHEFHPWVEPNNSLELA